MPDMSFTPSVEGYVLRVRLQVFPVISHPIRERRRRIGKRYWLDHARRKVRGKRWNGTEARSPGYRPGTNARRNGRLTRSHPNEMEI